MGAIICSVGMARPSLDILAPIVDPIQPRHACLLTLGFAVHVSLLRVPCAHCKDHSIFHVCAHLCKGSGASTSCPTVVDVSAEILREGGLLDAAIMAPISRWLHIEGWQINPLTVLHVETCNAAQHCSVSMELCDNCHDLGAVKGVVFAISLVAMPIGV